MKNNIVFSVFALLLIGVISYSFFWEKNKSEGEMAVAAQTGAITGIVTTELYFGEGNKTVALPDVEVLIRDMNNTVLTKTKTDVNGWYRTAELPYNTYLLCLEKSGYQSVCTKVDIEHAENYPGRQIIPLNDPKAFIYGKSLLKDGRPGFYRQEYYGIEFYTYVSIANRRTTYRCNSGGEYVIPFQVASKTQIKATCQNAVSTKYVYAGTNKKDLPLPNYSPLIGSVMMTENGNEVHRTGPGAKLKVVGDVNDPDGHTLTYQWFPWGNHPSFSSVNSSAVPWTLPGVKATYTMYLVVTDNYGGVGIKKQIIRAVDRRVLFSGNVRVMGSGDPVKNAVVDVNGETTLTDANGGFSFSVAESNGQRYVMNIDKTGMMAQSKIYFRDATGISYNLVANTSSTFNSQEEIVLIEREDEFTKFKTFDAQGEQIYRPPAVVRIPPNAIQDQDGKPFNGPVLASLRAIDLLDGNDLMPGDYGGLRDGEDQTLESFGAIDVQLRDANNPENKLKLDPDMEAEISIPISSPLEPMAKPNIDLWDYDTKDGLWIHIGSLAKAGNYYVGVTNMFSTLNADVSFTDAACIEIRDNPLASLFPGGDLKLIFQIPTGGVPKIKVTTVSSADLPLFVSRLPANANVAMTVIQLDAVNPTDPSLNDTLKIQILNTGPGVPGPANISPSTGECKIFYLDALVEFSATPIFLFHENNDSTNGDEYYKLIGAMDASSTPNFDLIQWKIDNGFNLGPDTTALYYNAGDLGFWRDMHVKTHPSGKTSFYVTNYATDADALAGVGAIATVCMEYSPVAGSANTADMTKFYVFDGSNTLVNNADLDGGGAKYIPDLCVVCHGGSPPASYTSFGGNATSFVDNFTLPDSSKMPNFIHFDVESFAYSTVTGSLRSDQETELRQLNEKVMQVKNTEAIKDFVKTAYGAAVTDPDHPLPVSNFIDQSVVPGWNNTGVPVGTTTQHDEFYLEVVATSCRACHITRSNDFFWFDDYTTFSTNFVRGAVCSNFTVPYMPNALITYKNFWTDSFRVETFKDYLNPVLLPCDDPN